MNPSLGLGEIKEVLTVMAEVEMTLARFYKTCGEIWPEDRAFWAHLVEQETQHARNILRMGKIIAQKTRLFEVHRPFNSAAMKTVLSGICANIERAKKGEFSRQRVLAIANDLEKSLIEAKYSEVFKTTDVEYQNLVNQIVKDTKNHQQIIARRLADAKAP